MWRTVDNAILGIRELKDKASSIINRVEEAEAITVMKNDRPVGRRSGQVRTFSRPFGFAVID